MPGPRSTWCAAVSPAPRCSTRRRICRAAVEIASSNTRPAPCPKLEVHALQAGGCRLATSMPARDRARDGDHLRDLVGDQRPAGVPVTADHVDILAGRTRAAIRPAAVSTPAWCPTASARRCCRPRGPARISDRHHHRVIPGRDLGADAHRLAPDHGGMAAQVLPEQTCRPGSGRRRKEPELVCQRRHLVGPGHCDGLAGITRPRPGRLDRVGEPQQRQAALAGWCSARSRSAPRGATSHPTPVPAHRLGLLGSTTSLVHPAPGATARQVGQHLAVA